MANKGFAYGMSATVAGKIAAKRDAAEELKVQNWIEEITGIKFDPSLSYEKNLRDGTILLNVAKKLQPSAIKKISPGNTTFKAMENIERFLTFCENYGMIKSDLFQVVYLYEESNIPGVTATLVALGRVCQTKPEWDQSSPVYKNWPILGPKPAEGHKREFDEKTIAEGKKIIGIQAGTNKMASQSGTSFGGRRQINVDDGPRT